jgi:hypothetical protein
MNWKCPIDIYILIDQWVIFLENLVRFHKLSVESIFIKIGVPSKKL